MSFLMKVIKKLSVLFSLQNNRDKQKQREDKKQIAVQFDQPKAEVPQNELNIKVLTLERAQ